MIMSSPSGSSPSSTGEALPPKVLHRLVEEVYLQSLSRIQNELSNANTNTDASTAQKHLCSPTAPCIIAHALLAPLVVLRLVHSTWDAAVRSLGLGLGSGFGEDRGSREKGLNKANANSAFFAPVEEGTYYPHAWHVDTRVRKAVLLGRYRVFRTISSEEGKRGVYLAYDLGGPQGCSMPAEVVIKAWVESTDFECVREVAAYRALAAAASESDDNPCRGVPHPRIASAQHDKTCDVHALVLPKLGPSLEDLRTLLPGGRFDLRMVLWVAIQMLNAYQSMHARGVIHNGAKPANICLPPRSSADASMLYAIDFGFSIMLPDVNSISGLNSNVKDRPLPLPSAHRVDAVGNRRFMSVFAHHGISQSQRDDLESLAYLLSYLFHGSLPWDNDRPAAPSRTPSDSNANSKLAAAAAVSRSYSPRSPNRTNTHLAH
ncbi:Protein kinase domain-containing protein [Mycena sanguinolenta]|uniref:Protein kinase domain-containing protein n=1 Tax=Mycena sanguinolenta TaxID=230812 RepID=A0A8H6ZED4_9AGAR|nr:Protein kinase domain-containing protein [Mycena sanguinolenta]